MDELSEEQVAKFETYLDLILKWNGRMNLTAVQDRMGILTRHFVECIACARALPDGIRAVLDFGSGAGFPGVPIAICRPEITVTLAESQAKKAGFLSEVVRVLNLKSRVFTGRAETINATFDCVTLRAVDRMKEAVWLASKLIAANGWLVIMSTVGTYKELVESTGGVFRWSSPSILPGSDQRIVSLGYRE